MARTSGHATRGVPGRGIRSIRRFHLAATIPAGMSGPAIPPSLSIRSGSGAGCLGKPEFMSSRTTDLAVTSWVPVLAGYVDDGRLVVRVLAEEQPLPSLAAWADRFAYRHVSG